MGHDYTLKSGLVGLVLFFFGIALTAQDARFAQFYATPLQLNPALTGVYAGTFRTTVNYRELYASVLGPDAYRTISAGMEFRKPVLRGDYAAFGITALRDQVGEANFTRTQAALSGSFLKSLGGGTRYRGSGNYLVVGGQLGFGQRGFDWEKLWYSNQFFVDNESRKAYIDYAADPGESFPRSNTGMYLDFNAGLLWYTIRRENKSLYFGGAIQHVNQPNISFMDAQDERLYRKYVVHGGGEMPLGDRGFSLLPALAAMRQGPAFSTTAGMNLRYTQREWQEVALRAGAWAHLSNRVDKTGLDAIILSAILELERWQLGLSYDLTASSLAVTNGARGAFEVSLIYTQPENFRSRVACPNF